MKSFGWFKKSKAVNEKTAGIGSPDKKGNTSDGIDTPPANETVSGDSGDVSPEAHPHKADLSGEPGFFKRLKSGLAKTRLSFTGGIEKLFAGRKTVDDGLLEELEELLITSDMGVQTAEKLIARITSAGMTDPAQLKTVLRNEIQTILQKESSGTAQPSAGPQIIMVVGVNGVGKTTTIGKLAAKSTAAGKKVLIAAADTFRAAAIEQLMIWSERARAEIVKHKEGADPAAVAFDALEAAAARSMDVVLVDTAGRLHTRVNLMEELKKMKRIISKKIPAAPHEILLVLDATTGQNALAQARMFHDALGITAIAVTKLDGTAKGGIVVSICDTLNIPLKYIGVGEKIEDLQDFDPKQFVNALF
ncbi:MAG: signal recognition particle-docking protein FtsY [Desulfobacterales bacterium]|nr:signal recognition particle-docking protein FtsY [Desulfobacterales bacterium]